MCWGVVLVGHMSIDKGFFRRVHAVRLWGHWGPFLLQGGAATCVCVCVLGGGGSTVFTRSSRLDLYGHAGVLGSGRSPL